jgi:hypothetical protein
MSTIEDIVRSHVFLDALSSKGWSSIFCQVCGDGTHSKGPRGGWLFEGETCFYNCFNCGVSGNFDPNRDVPHSKNMYSIFRAFGIPINEVNDLITSKSKNKKTVVKKQDKVHLPHLKQPDYFKLLRDFPEDSPLATEARKFLWENYKITDKDYPFFMSTGKTNSHSNDDIYLCRALRTRIIIPAYSRDNRHMMFWQARTLTDDPKKYISASVENSGGVMFGMDNLYSENKENPLYVTEGFFDSWHVNGVAVIANNMKRAKIVLLNNSRRPKVVIPDYNKDGMILANQAIDLGWGISLPDILPCVDICKAINRFGKLFVVRSIVKNTYYDFEAKLRLKDFELKNNIRQDRRP